MLPQDSGTHARLPSNFVSFVEGDSMLTPKNLESAAQGRNSAPSDIHDLGQQPTKSLVENQAQPPKQYGSSRVINSARTGERTNILSLSNYKNGSNPFCKDIERLISSRPDRPIPVINSESEPISLQNVGIVGTIRRLRGVECESGESSVVSHVVLHKKSRSRSILMKPSVRRSEKNTSLHLVPQSTKRVSFNPYKMVFCFSPGSG